ncbi:hypothetical protein [Lewinella sp. 4G2]|uniref:hypothetical protein n=1 Tax=Lewinella sp. 4G2 TaxID=1803372 RepID=UPI0007DEDEFA|nr:hypothetical protein [Lewinella sp. 4G2]OAV43602.1 hypothetical protein A3850_003420 [Lewinella sp. 4G2]
MQRVLIIGCCGAGKSTFARKLADATGLPLIHLDQAYWQPDWTEPPKAEWEAKVTELVARDAWIMDGNYAGSLSLRLPRADTVIYLDYPTAKCLWRVVKRVTKYHGQQRPDMPPGCHERFDWEFFHYVATFNLTRRRLIHEHLASLGPGQRVFRFTRDGEGDEFLLGVVN